MIEYMKPEVKIIFPGYASADNGGRSCSNIILIKTGDHNIIVDPGTVPSQEVLIDKLKAEELTVSDIDIVFLTHWHTDHARNVGFFGEAKVLDFFGWWEGDLFTGYKPGDLEQIELLRTPGHSNDNITFIIETEQGKVAICGDVFWKENFPAKDPFASDLNELTKSRTKVLKIADFIIPGHGEMFEVKR